MRVTAASLSSSHNPLPGEVGITAPLAHQNTEPLGGGQLRVLKRCRSLTSVVLASLAGTDGRRGGARTER